MAQLLSWPSACLSSTKTRAWSREPLWQKKCLACGTHLSSRRWERRDREIPGLAYSVTSKPVTDCASEMVGGPEEHQRLFPWLPHVWAHTCMHTPNTYERAYIHTYTHTYVRFWSLISSFWFTRAEVEPRIYLSSEYPVEYMVILWSSDHTLKPTGFIHSLRYSILHAFDRAHSFYKRSGSYEL